MESKRQHSYTSLIVSETGVKGVFSACIWETLNHLRVGKMFSREMYVFYFLRSSQS